MAKQGDGIQIRPLRPERLLITVKGNGLGLLTQNGAQYTPPKVGEKGQKDTRTDEQKFVESLYILNPARDGCKYGIPARAFRAALVEAGKTKLTRTTGAQAQRVFSIEGGPDGLLPIYTDQDPVMSLLRGRNPNSRGGGKGAPVDIIRAHFRSWSCLVPVVLFGAGEADTIELFQVAGLVSGIGGFRQSCGGDYGKFNVEKVERVKQAKEIEDDSES